MRLNKVVITGKTEDTLFCAIATDTGYDKSQLDKFMEWECDSTVILTSEFPPTATITIEENIFTVDGVKYSVKTHEPVAPGTVDLLCNRTHDGVNMPDCMQRHLPHSPWLSDEWDKMKMVNYDIVLTSTGEIRGISQFSADLIKCPVPTSRVVKLLAYGMCDTLYLMAKLDDGQILYWEHTNYHKTRSRANYITHQQYVSREFYDFGPASHGFMLISDKVIRIMDYRLHVYDTPYEGEVQLTHGYSKNYVVISNVLYYVSEHMGLYKIMDGMYGLYKSSPIARQ